MCAAQSYCDCDSVYRKKTFTGYCTEYLDMRMYQQVKGYAVFKRYMYYSNGRPSKMYPFEYVYRNDKILWNDKPVMPHDSLQLLNGLYKIRDKYGKDYIEIYYKEGFLTKEIVRRRGRFNLKKNGRRVTEIAEYDYATAPFKQHYIRYKNDGTLECNFYCSDENGILNYETTDLMMSEDPLKFKGVYYTLE